MTRAGAPEKVMLVVSSLMGAGHLQRILLIAKAVEQAGGRALVVSGGRAPDHLDPGDTEIAHLPPLWSDGTDYSRLLSPEGLVDDAYMERRAAHLCALFDRFAPDVLVTELFPFGRRSLSHEFLRLLEHAKGRARIYCSIRDVLEPKKKPKRHAETAARLEQWYDGVLVHGDPSVIGLDSTWPPAPEFAEMIRYTGYVCQQAVAPLPSDEVLVAVGGGVIGRSLLAASVEAARGGARIWRLRVGGADAGSAAATLQAQAGDAPVIIEPVGPDYRARLAGCACSVSLFGYNTATDLLVAGPPAVISPMDEGGEREQIIRADAFAAAAGFVRLSGMTAPALRKAVDQAISQGGARTSKIALDGAALSAAVLLGGSARR